MTDFFEISKLDVVQIGRFFTDDAVRLYVVATMMMIMMMTEITTPMMIFIFMFSQKCLRLILTAAR